jgi:cytochrome b pre-mRNA-processing protein 3
LTAFFGLARRGRHERAGFSLYTAAVTAAREPFLYQSLRVPDTLDGRFDLVCLHAFLLVRRLQREEEPGPALAQAVFDAMFSDMDISLREMGVGDLSVGRRVRAMWEAFNGRALAYDAALTAGDAAALEAALVRNVWRGEAPANGCAAALVRLVMAQAALLDGQDFAALAAGGVAFRPAAEAAA